MTMQEVLFQTGTVFLVACAVKLHAFTEPKALVSYALVGDQLFLLAAGVGIGGLILVWLRMLITDRWMIVRRPQPAKRIYVEPADY